jgi:hypothetical protein
MDALFAPTGIGMTAGTVASMSLDGDVVQVLLPDGTELACDRLHVTALAPVPLGLGDRVLVHCAGDETRGVVIGRIGASAGGIAMPDTLVLEATQQVTLRAGDGSVTIRADGKVITKGKDVVSHATHVNRIKGGSVSIN